MTTKTLDSPSLWDRVLGYTPIAIETNLAPKATLDQLQEIGYELGAELIVTKAEKKDKKTNKNQQIKLTKYRGFIGSDISLTFKGQLLVEGRAGTHLEGVVKLGSYFIGGVATLLLLPILIAVDVFPIETMGALMLLISIYAVYSATRALLDRRKLLRLLATTFNKFPDKTS